MTRARSRKLREPLLGAILLCAAASQAQDIRPLLDYPCDDAAGTVLKDSGSAQSNGTLNASTNTEATAITITCEAFDQWQPILDDEHVQLKGIIAGTDAVLADGERPLVFDREKDYAIDCAGGKIKALPGGRVELGNSFALQFRHSNPGPAWSQGQGAGALRFDGIDDFVTLGRLREKDALKALTIELRVLVDQDCLPDAIILAQGLKGPENHRLGLRLRDGRLEFFYPALAGSGARSLTAGALSRGDWHHIKAVYDGSAAILAVDGKEAGRQNSLAGTVKLSELTLGGIRDPEFFKGEMRDVRIYEQARP